MSVLSIIVAALAQLAGSILILRPRRAAKASTR